MVQGVREVKKRFDLRRCSQKRYSLIYSEAQHFTFPDHLCPLPCFHRKSHNTRAQMAWRQEVVDVLAPYVMQKSKWGTYMIGDYLKGKLEAIQVLMTSMKVHNEKKCTLAIVPQEIFWTYIMRQVVQKMLWEEHIPIPQIPTGRLISTVEHAMISHEVGMMFIDEADPDEILTEFTQEQEENPTPGELPRRALVVNLYDYDTYMDNCVHITIIPIDVTTMIALETRHSYDMCYDIEPCGEQVSASEFQSPSSASEPQSPSSTASSVDLYHWKQAMSSKRLLEELEFCHEFLNLKADLVWDAPHFEDTVRGMATSFRLEITVYHGCVDSIGAHRYVFLMKQQEEAQEHLFLVVDVHPLEIRTCVWPQSWLHWDEATANTQAPDDVWDSEFVKEWHKTKIVEFTTVLESLIPVLAEGTLKEVKAVFADFAFLAIASS